MDPASLSRARTWDVMLTRRWNATGDAGEDRPVGDIIENPRVPVVDAHGKLNLSGLGFALAHSNPGSTALIVERYREPILAFLQLSNLEAAEARPLPQRESKLGPARDIEFGVTWLHHMLGAPNFAGRVAAVKMRMAAAVHQIAGADSALKKVY